VVPVGPGAGVIGPALVVGGIEVNIETSIHSIVNDDDPMAESMISLVYGTVMLAVMAAASAFQIAAVLVVEICVSFGACG